MCIRDSGIECELTPIYLVDGQPFPMGLYQDSNHDFSSSDLIVEIAKEHPEWKLKLEKGNTLGGVDIGADGNISFEPGGQIEISTQPFRCLDMVLKNLDQSQSVLKEKFRKHNISLLHLGINPCLLYTSPSPRDATLSRMPSSA